MSETTGELLKRPLYVFDLPCELLVTIHLKDSATPLHPSAEANPQISNTNPSQDLQETDGDSKPLISCLLCQVTFASVQEQRQHVKSDWHNYNLKQKVRGGHSATENEFEKLVDELDESISGSGSDSSESEVDGEGAKETTLSALLKKQGKLANDNTEGEDFMPKKRKRGFGKTPLIWLSTLLLPSNTSLGIYRALFTNAEQEDPDMVESIRKKQLRPVPTKYPTSSTTEGSVPLPSTTTSPSIFMCMIGGGHFAGMIVSLAPKQAKGPTGAEQRQAIVIAHKTFHRYTTRRKQGGAQSANDSAKGAAHSAGSSLRRYNEVALEQEIRALIAEWHDLIAATELIFVRATGSSNRRILFGPYDGQVLRQNDPRNRTFPFSTRRATQAELMRAFVELTRVKISQVDEAALAAAAAAEEQKPESHQQSKPSIPTPKPKPTKEEEAALLHTSQIQALTRRSKAPALLSYITNHNVSPNYAFRSPSTQANHHAPTPLHLASSINSPAVVLALLTKGGADPTLPNGEGKPAFDLAGDRTTRDAFRVARSELGEEKWDWSAAHIPPPIAKAEAEKREKREKAEAEKAEAERRKGEEERLRREGPVVEEKKGKGRVVGQVAKTAEERREEEGRGMSNEMRMRLERERRARAAEARLGRMDGGGGGGR